MYDVSNGFIGNLNALISETYTGSSMPEYDNSYYTFSKNNMKKMIGDYILYQILQYPTKEGTKGVFVQEYVLPQLMMEAIQNKGDWLGLQYQTSKPPMYKVVNEYWRVPNLNYCFIIPYTADTAYNEQYIKKFFYEIYFQKENDIELEKVQQMIEVCFENCRKAQAQKYIMQEYFHYTVCVETYLKEMITLNTEEYVETKEFQIQKLLLYKFLIHINEIICNPDKYQIIKYSDN